ncbi:winged helix-turn-helix transcriptional regulator [Streptomyces sp. NPDC017988]|uniref:winged helix-turn-helix transcriptional regulator n=1 Tax=Streptomyces sp. NPDC017988 TaxID=3365025 RepID=UPI0037BBCA46
MPPRVEYEMEYEITALGRSLGPVLAALTDWSDVHLASVEAARHAYDAAQA